MAEFEVPKCCERCVHLGLPVYKEFGVGPEMTLPPECEIGVWFPTRKQTYKRRRSNGREE